MLYWKFFMLPVSRRWVTALALVLFGLLCSGDARKAAGQDAVAAETAAVPLTTEQLAEVRQAEQQRIAAINKAVPSACAIFSPGGGGGGSGVVITPDGYALTNFHVVKPAGNYMYCGMADGQRYDAVIVGIDPTGDVALVKLLGRDDFPVAELGNSDQVRVGDWCFAVGNPFLLATDFQPTVTYGVVSGVHRYQYPAGTLLEYADCIQTDASINPGNSGGPLFDSQGRLIGINGRGSFEKRGRVNVGVGYAISINQIKHFMGYLRSGRIVDHATLGATVTTNDEGRVVVADILQDSDAYRRGLRYNDEIIGFGDREITTVNGFKNALGIYPRGWRVPLSFRREGKRYDVLVRLTGVHSPEQLTEAVQGPSRPTPQPDQDKPEKKDGDEKDGETPKQPAPPTPRPGRGQPKIVVPPEAKKLIEPRRGFANYYFNRVQLEEVIARFQEHAGGNYPDATWNLAGKFNGRATFEVELRNDFVTGRYPEGPDRIDLSQDLDTQLAPIGSHGMLASLHVWKTFLSRGLKEFGNAYYLGTMPVAGQDEPCHVVVGTYNVLEVRLIFSPSTGELAAMEVYSSDQIDPCELFFTEYRDSADDRRLPKQIDVRVGLESFAVLDVETFEVLNEAGGEKAKADGDAPTPKGESEKELADKKADDKKAAAAQDSPQPDPSQPDPNQHDGEGQTTLAPAPGFARVSIDVFPKLVKIYGAGGVRGLEPYQSGFLISAEGHILTVWSYVLDTDFIGVTLDDGRRYTAEVMGADPRMEVAILKIDAKNTDYFDLSEAADLRLGQRVLAYSNLFGVATGDEPYSLMHGVVSAKTDLQARRGVFETPYRGVVYVVDAITNNPGAAGGVLTDRRGRIAGLLGKELRNSQSGTWLNYSIPIASLQKSVDAILSGKVRPPQTDTERKKPAEPLTLAELGIVLLPNVVAKTPPFVDRVRPGSVAAKAGVQQDDLILFINDLVISSRTALEEELSYIDRIDEARLVVERDRELIEIVLQLE